MGQQLFDISGKSVIVTGGCSGIGWAITELFAQQGARVYFFDLDEKLGRSLEARLLESYDFAQFVPCDVSDAAHVKSAFIATGLEHLDVLINNAGIAHIGTVEETNEVEFDRLYEVNVKGVFHCTQNAVPLMKAHGGSILNIASIASMVGIKDRFAYSMTKGAVLSMTYSTAKDYLAHNIRCNCLAPARIHTPFVDGFISKNYPGQEEEMFHKLSRTQPLGRMGRPEEVAAFVLYLASDEASFLTGSCYAIDGGFITLNG